MRILAINGGSSSDKSSLFDLARAETSSAPLPPLWDAEIDWTSPDGPTLQVRTGGGRRTERLDAVSRPDAIKRMIETLWTGASAVLESPSEIAAVGHRVVHGGQAYRETVRITSEVKEAIQRLVLLAPAHNPANLDGIKAAEEIFGETPQFAAFDTAFHATIPEFAALYAGPYEWAEQGIRRYGFHGISHEYVARRAASILGKRLDGLRVVSCHLGNGASLAAILNGRSVDTTMGFTPMEGLMMGSRSGTIDPGLFLHLLRQDGATAPDVDRILNKESGLKGISGVSSDMRAVQKSAGEGGRRAGLALEMYVHSLRRHIGAMIGSMGGIDVLIFTAGIGENAAGIRAQVCESFQFLGLRLDSSLNLAVSEDCDIAAPESNVRVLVIESRENYAIARECARLLAPAG